MNEQAPTTQTIDKPTYDELAKQATDRDEILALREMAQQDLAQTAAITLNSGGDPSTSHEEIVTSIGADKLEDLHTQTMGAYAPDEVVAPASMDWHTEEK